LEVVDGEIQELRKEMEKDAGAEEHGEMEVELTDLLENRHALTKRLRELHAMQEDNSVAAAG